MFITLLCMVVVVAVKLCVLLAVKLIWIFKDLFIAVLSFLND
jgi:hypothetical protein